MTSTRRQVRLDDDLDEQVAVWAIRNGYDALSRTQQVNLLLRAHPALHDAPTAVQAPQTGRVVAPGFQRRRR